MPTRKVRQDKGDEFGGSGKLKGKSHDKGGIPIEAEGGEYVIKKDSVNKETEPILKAINETGKIPSLDARNRSQKIPAISEPSDPGYEDADVEGA